MIHRTRLARHARTVAGVLLAVLLTACAGAPTVTAVTIGISLTGSPASRSAATMASS